MFAKLKIGTKISLGFAIILLMLIILGGNSFFSLKSSQEKLETISKANDRLVLALKIDSEYVAAVSSLRAYIAYGDEKYVTQAQESLDTALILEDKLLELARAEKKPEVQSLIDQTNQYKTMAFNKLIPLVGSYHKALKAGDMSQAALLKDQFGAVLKTMVPFATQINAITTKFAGYNEEIFSDNIKLANKDSQQVIYTSMIISIVALLIGIGISFYLTKIIRTPIIEMLGGAQRYANGDLSKPINVDSADELGELAQSFNKMRDSFVAMIQNIATSAEQVAAASEQLTASAEQSAQASNQVAMTITEVAQGSEQQMISVEEGTRAVKQMSNNIQQVAANTGTVTSIAGKTASSAQQGGKVITSAISQMKNIEETVTSSAQVVSKLGERSKEIGQIVSTIAGIAGQTNLLALNAAIEAARAGEQGRGFAVVAEEVRKLAEQSEAAADQIASLISEIQGETDRAVTAMNNGTREVKTGAEVVYTAGKAFNDIETLINDVLSQVTHISKSIQEVATGSSTIVASVQTIDEISRTTASQTQTVAAATEEQSASMEEIASSSQTLAKMAEDLQVAVQKFKM
ncbi:methyl-accepting chemotaxis protein [Dendrosporobacter sp. 1207_IL3150]|uniref:methyl-accepting chemotaxis protein n=1 Tax=Dendrosporobacter sp. 1207_IL3150 TaxID=3084054 RepID=UPI002FDB9257